MATPAEMLTLQFLEWIAEAPRSYAEVMDAWRTSCPRLSIWEDAALAGLVRRDAAGSVVLTTRGRSLLRPQALPRQELEAAEAASP